MLMWRIIIITIIITIIMFNNRSRGISKSIIPTRWMILMSSWIMKERSIIIMINSIPTKPICNNADLTSSYLHDLHLLNPAHLLYGRSRHLNVMKSKIRSCSIWIILMMTRSLMRTCKTLTIQVRRIRTLLGSRVAIAQGRWTRSRRSSIMSTTNQTSCQNPSDMTFTET